MGFFIINKSLYLYREKDMEFWYFHFINTLRNSKNIEYNEYIEYIEYNEYGGGARTGLGNIHECEYVWSSLTILYFYHKT